jgi:type III secretion protein N (ATPase)
MTPAPEPSAIDWPTAAVLGARLRQAFAAPQSRPDVGRIRAVRGLMLRARLPRARLGELYRLEESGRHATLRAEVVGLDGDDALLLPLGDLSGVSGRTEVIATGRTLAVRLWPTMTGSILDGLGRVVTSHHADDATTSTAAAGPEAAWYPLDRLPPDPLTRTLISSVQPVGVRAIDALLTLGRGQRIGIFGPPGVGKSTLLASLVQGAEADVVVVGLVGERGREVREFLERSLDEVARRRCVTVVATSDRPAIERAKSVLVATAVAEYFRDRGGRVLLVIDSLTRYARALREIGLAAGELPTRRGFPPSLFAHLPRLLERAGPAETGSITAFYTVLTEGDRETDPIAEEATAILDGHIILSPELAAGGHYPAIDVLTSRSRLMDAVVDPEHRNAARRLRALLARYAEVELAHQLGEYQKGGDPLADEAIEKVSSLRAFLAQTPDARPSFADTRTRLIELASHGASAPAP